MKLPSASAPAAPVVRLHPRPRRETSVYCTGMFHACFEAMSGADGLRCVQPWHPGNCSIKKQGSILLGAATLGLLPASGRWQPSTQAELLRPLLH